MPHMEKKLTLIDFGLAHINSEKFTYNYECFHAVVQEQCLHGTAEICKKCYYRSPQLSPRGGTKGFKAPEILFKYPH